MIRLEIDQWALRSGRPWLRTGPVSAGDPLENLCKTGLSRLALPGPWPVGRSRINRVLFLGNTVFNVKKQGFPMFPMEAEDRGAISGFTTSTPPQTPEPYVMTLRLKVPASPRVGLACSRPQAPVRSC